MRIQGLDMKKRVKFGNEEENKSLNVDGESDDIKRLWKEKESTLGGYLQMQMMEVEWKKKEEIEKRKWDEIEDEWRIKRDIEKEEQRLREEQEKERRRKEEFLNANKWLADEKN